MKPWLLSLLMALAGSVPSGLAADAPPPNRPNILWIIVDDMSANFSCYGEKTIQTPHVDRLAREGTRFSRAFVTAPVCSPCRSALITGMYQTSIGAQNHRSGRGSEKIHLPPGVEPVPVLFQRAGYHTSVGSWPSRGKALGKTDYNFEWNPAMYDSNDWSGRKSGQPFFAQIQLAGGKLRDGNPQRVEPLRKQLGSATKTEDVKLPPYYPRDPVILDDWARYLDAARYTDKQVGEILQRLETEGIAGQTIVFFMTDHGISHARGKQFLYDEGLHVPLIARGPGIERGTVRVDLVAHIDLAATSLALAGIAVPAAMQGRNLLASNPRPRDAVFSARDRCDETVEHLRSARTEHFKYIRNFLPQRPHLQPNAYKDHKPTLIRLRELHGAGQLPELVEKILFAPTRAAEELYDLEKDPFEIQNLATNPAHRSALEELRRRLDRWMEETGDRGRQPESESMYDSDMAVYLDAKSGVQAADAEELKANIKLMKQWAKEGK
jgi:arylsulfatase A-like enzyme